MEPKQTEKQLWCVVRKDAKGKPHWEGNYGTDRTAADRAAKKLQQTTADKVYVSEYLAL